MIGITATLTCDNCSEEREEVLYFRHKGDFLSVEGLYVCEKCSLDGLKKMGLNGIYDGDVPLPFVDVRRKIGTGDEINAGKKKAEPIFTITKKATQ